MDDIRMEVIRYQRLAELGRNLEGFAHNTAGPLNIILGYTQILMSRYAEDKAVSKIWDACLDLDKSLKELGEHLEYAQQEFIREIDVNKLVSRQMELMRANNFFKHNIECQSDLAEDLPAVKAIYGDISICIDILLNNAIDAVYLSDIRKIVVKTLRYSHKGENGIKIIVRDTGEGFNQELISSYFEPGYSGWQGIDGKSGMGLSVADYIIRKMKGRIILKDSCGCGAEATMYIPVGDESHAV